jgi:hypothetical protein
MVGVDTSNNMYLGNTLSHHLTSTLLNLVESQVPSISIALTTTERAELAVEDTDIRGL